MPEYSPLDDPAHPVPYWQQEGYLERLRAAQEWGADEREPVPDWRRPPPGGWPAMPWKGRKP